MIHFRIHRSAWIQYHLTRSVACCQTQGALTIVGPLELLQKMPLEHVRRATNRLLRPWKDGDRTSVGSVGSVLVTSPAGVPRGKRHRFRVTAEEFRPDPLNQPGGPKLSWCQCHEFDAT